MVLIIKIIHHMQNAGLGQQRILGTAIRIVHMASVGLNLLRLIKIKKTYKENNKEWISFYGNRRIIW